MMNYKKLQKKEIAAAVAKKIIYDVYIAPAGAGKAFSGRIITYNSYTGLMRVKLTHAPELFTSHFDVKSYDVSFGINRLNFQIQHYALELFKNNGLFDLLINNPRNYLPDDSISADDYTEKNDLNPEQHLAVRNIKSSDISIPFMIFGPPGKSLMHHFDN